MISMIDAVSIAVRKRIAGNMSKLQGAVQEPPTTSA